MKAMIIVVSPTECANLLNGDLSVLVRKINPRCKLPVDAYIYCKEGKPYLYDCKEIYLGKDDHRHYISKVCCNQKAKDLLNGKVVAKVTLNKVEPLKWHRTTGIDLDYYKVVYELDNEYELVKQSCLSHGDIEKYLQVKDKCNYRWHFDLGYAWHIDNLEIFDKPKDLFDFRVWNRYECDTCPYYIKFGIDDCLYSSHPKCLVPLINTPKTFCYIEI